MSDLDIRQGLSRVLTVTDHKRDYSTERIEVRAVPSLGDAVLVGAGQGEPVGTDMIFDVTFDVPTGFYKLNVCAEDEIVFPPDERIFTVQVHDAC